MSKILVILFLVLMLPTTSGAWDEPQNFRGLKWGSSPEELLKAFPSAYEYTNIPEKRPYGERVRIFNLFDSRIADRIVHIGFSFLDNKLVYVDIGFKSEDFSILEQAFKERYGPPHAEERSIVKTRMGVEYENKELTWRGPTIRITLRKYVGKITDGGATIGKHEFLHYLAEFKRQRGTKAAKDL